MESQMGEKWWGGGGLPTPGVFGKASPQVRVAGTPQTATILLGEAAETAPETPVHEAPPTFKYSSRARREVN